MRLKWHLSWSELSKDNFIKSKQIYQPFHLGKSEIAYMIDSVVCRMASIVIGSQLKSYQSKFGGYHADAIVGLPKCNCDPTQYTYILSV